MENNIPGHKSCCKTRAAGCPCPVCDNAGRKVTPLTLAHHLSPALRAQLGDDAAFCLNPACEVVYFNPGGFVVRRGQTLVPVTIKDGSDEVRVCYCFDIKRGDLRKDIREGRNAAIPERIRQGISEGRCDCERMNPQGTCCLGNVVIEIKKIEKEERNNV